MSHLQPRGISTGPWDDQPCEHGNIDCEQCKEEAWAAAHYVVWACPAPGRESLFLHPVNDTRWFTRFFIAPRHIEGDIKVGSIVTLDETPDGIDVYVLEETK